MFVVGNEIDHLDRRFGAREIGWNLTGLWCLLSFIFPGLHNQQTKLPNTILHFAFRADLRPFSQDKAMQPTPA